MSFFKSVLVVSFNCALEAFALACTLNVDNVACCEYVGFKDIAYIYGACVVKSKFLKESLECNIVFLKMTLLGLVYALGGYVAEA